MGVSKHILKPGQMGGGKRCLWFKGDLAEVEKSEVSGKGGLVCDNEKQH